MDSCRHYLEFGSGESTLYASGVSTIETIDSVESSLSYIDENLKQDAAISNALSNGKLVFHSIDIGETGGWGFPINKDKKHVFPNYSLSVFSKKSEHDLVLVDGRFRVACTLSSILNTPQNCIIMIHDFWNRPRYHTVLQYVDILDRVDTLGVFRKKKNINLKKVQSLLKTYQYLPEDITLTREIKRLSRKLFRTCFMRNP